VLLQVLQLSLRLLLLCCFLLICLGSGLHRVTV